MEKDAPIPKAIDANPDGHKVGEPH
jgi:hypothetical protein